MSMIRQKAHNLIERLPEDQIAYIINIIEGIKGISIPNENPDELDLFLIKESEKDNDETEDLDDFVKELGFDVDELQN
ncbi:MAG: hypothetical protein GX053_02060 [Tissierella sp.]|nr:hypothetical protein [Tissierella sp.]